MHRNKNKWRNYKSCHNITLLLHYITVRLSEKHLHTAGSYAQGCWWASYRPSRIYIGSMHPSYGFYAIEAIRPNWNQELHKTVQKLHRKNYFESIRKILHSVWIKHRWIWNSPLAQMSLKLSVCIYHQQIEVVCKQQADLTKQRLGLKLPQDTTNYISLIIEAPLWYSTVMKAISVYTRCVGQLR